MEEGSKKEWKIEGRKGPREGTKRRDRREGIEESQTHTAKRKKQVTTQIVTRY